MPKLYIREQIGKRSFCGKCGNYFYKDKQLIPIRHERCHLQKVVKKRSNEIGVTI